MLTILRNGIQVSNAIVIWRKITIVETNTYVYDFKGRVTQPSIKNF